MRPKKPEQASNGLSASPITTTLPTPLPHELPPTPYRNALSLPPTPHDPGHQNGHHVAENNLLAGIHYPHGGLPEIRLQESSPNLDQESSPTQNTDHFAGYPPDQLAVDVLRPPPSRRRIHPPSPPVLHWNPAIEPPPRTPAALSTFPQNTFFTNVWDKAPSKLHDATYQSMSASTDLIPLTSASSPDWRASAFFNPPPASDIPEHLLREGRYANVTGPARREHLWPLPDPNKVAPIFPWEEQPRSRPGRVFPSSDTPPPGAFLQRERTPPPAQEQHPISIYTPPVHAHIGQPGSLNFTNAWDEVPSIQNYASKLARPHHGAQPVPAAPFETDEWKKHEQEKFSPWLAKEEETSMDGDDEDDESDAKENSSRQRSRSGSGATTPQGHLHKGRKYRARGVQATRETRSQATQVSTAVGRGQSSGSRTRISVATQGAPLAGALDEQWSASSPAYRRLSSFGAPSAGDSPLGFNSPHGAASPRNYSPPTESSSAKSSPPGPTPRKRPSPSTARITTVSSVGVHLTPSTRAPSLTRSASNETTLSSVGPSSPPDSHDLTLPQRKTSRVWDPARAVDIFKRDSEEVLSRFLKMGSFDDASAHQHVGL